MPYILIDSRTGDCWHGIPIYTQSIYLNDLVYIFSSCGPTGRGGGSCLSGRSLLFANVGKGVQYSNCNPVRVTE